MPADATLGALADALSSLYRLSGSARFHDRTVAATGVSVTRTGLRFLSLARDTGPISATRLAAGLDLSQPTASRVLQQLELAGLVAREPSSSDGRVSNYVVTRAGRRALERVRAYHVSQLDIALRDIDPERRAALAAAVTDLVERLQRTEPQRAEPAAAEQRPA